MSLILAEGFGVYDSSTYAWLIDSAWTRYGLTTQYDYIVPTAGRSSTPAIRFGRNGGAPQIGFANVALAAEKSTLFAGFAYKCTPSTPGYRPVIGFYYGTSIQTSLYVDATGAIKICDDIGGNVLGSSAGGVITTAYQYWEVKVVVDGSSGSVTVKIDGSQVLNATGIDTQTYGSGGITHIEWANAQDSATYLAYLDDVIIYDDQGTNFNDFMGDLAVLAHLPEADGSDTDWTSTLGTQYDAVNDVGSGWDTNYIYSSTVGHQDCFTITPGGTYPSIVGVEVAAHGYNSGAGTAKIKPYVRISGIVYYGDELTMSAGSSDKRSYVWATNPATGTLWAKSVVAAAEFGFEVTEIS